MGMGSPSGSEKTVIGLYFSNEVSFHLHRLSVVAEGWDVVVDVDAVFTICLVNR